MIQFLAQVLIWFQVNKFESFKCPIPILVSSLTWAPDPDNMTVTGVGAELGTPVSWPPLTLTLDRVKVALCWPGAAGLNMSPMLTDWPGLRRPALCAMEKKDGSMTALHWRRHPAVLVMLKELWLVWPRPVMLNSTCLWFTMIWLGFAWLDCTPPKIKESNPNLRKGPLTVPMIWCWSSFFAFR